MALSFSFLPRRAAGLFGAGLLIAALPAAAAWADPKSPDCALATRIGDESKTGFRGFALASGFSRQRAALGAFRQHAEQAQGQARDEGLKAALADVVDSAGEISDLADQLNADRSLWGTRDFTFAVNNANAHHDSAGQGLAEAVEAVCG